MNLADLTINRRLGRACQVRVVDDVRSEGMPSAASDRQKRELARLRAGVEALAESTGVARDANEDLLERALSELRRYNEAP